MFASNSQIQVHMAYCSLTVKCYLRHSSSERLIFNLSLQEVKGPLLGHCNCI